MENVFIGTSGFYYASWKENFYPKEIEPSAFLEYYGGHFNSVEINSTFYAVPKVTSVERWRESVPKDFRFAFKALQDISHSLDLLFDEKDVFRFLDALELFADDSPRNVILFQLPSSTNKNPEQFSNLIKVLPTTFNYAFEFRHISWFDEEIYDIARLNNIAIVTADTPKRTNGGYVWPRKDIETADFSYLRLHGSTKLYASPYSELELTNFATHIKKKQDTMKTAFCFLNNTPNWSCSE